MNINDYEKMMNVFKDITSKYQQAILHLSKDLANMSKHPIFSTNELNSLMSSFYCQAMMQPEHWITMQTKFSERLAGLITDTVQKSYDQTLADSYAEKPKDRRFKDEAWKNNPYFNFIKQFYLMSSEIWNEYIEDTTKGLPNSELIKFLNKQLLDGICPSNFVLSNPTVLQTSLEQNGENLVRGLDNLLNDLKKYNDYISISTTNQNGFELGKNIAATKGKVVYKNELMELLCFQTKAKVHKVPIFIVPAWINKYYILDLSPHNSLIKWLADNNFQVFIVSWINPDASHKDTKFEDYAIKGIIEPCNFLRKELKIKELNAIGYCLGGTLLAMSLAYMKAKNISLFKSASFLTTLLDFNAPGELSLFINDTMLKTIEKEMDEVGYLDGRYMSLIFSILKANELIWHFMINNYLLGRSPEAFDVLYWNSDSTNLPTKMHSYYLRNMYLHNNLKKPNELYIEDVPINLETIDIPTFFLAAKEDHIAPATAVFDSFKLLVNSPKKFCLTDSGHIVGIVNPPTQSKYCYWVDDHNIEENYELWNKKSRKCTGSWWPYWLGWIKKNSGKQTEDIRYETFPCIEEAPGSYVKKRL